MAQRKKATRPKAPARVKVSSEAEQALIAIADEMAELSADEVLRVNIDVARSVSIALGAEPQIGALTDEVKEALPGHDVEKMSRLRTYALAALYAHLDAHPGPQNADLAELVSQGTALKQTLMVAAEALAHAELVDGTRLAEIRTGTGHLDLATDLVALGALFDVSWEQVEGKTFVAYAQVEEASRLGTALLVALGAKNHVANRASPEVINRKHRAFTLLVRAYDDARRAIAYLRWHDGDVDLVAPSLYKRSKRRATAADEVEETQETEESEAATEVDEGDAEESGASGGETSSVTPGKAPAVTA